MTPTAADARAARRERDERKTPKRKSMILDAAEGLFARRGYYGTSLRDIAAEAGVTVALLSYHFTSKEGLFGAVIERRAADNAEGMRNALKDVLADAPGARPDLEAVLRAFFAPVVDRSMRGGPGWKNYTLLMAQCANLPQHAGFVSAMPENYEPLERSFIAAIRAALPGMAESDLQWSFYFYEAAIAHILAESGVIDRHTDGAFRSSDLDAIVPRLARFCAGGFRALEEPATPAGAPARRRAAAPRKARRR